MKTLKTLFTIVFFSSVILGGCSKVNHENFDKIKVGMEYAQIEKIIGKPDKCDAVLGMKNCVWGNEGKNITIKFVAEKVVFPTMKGL